MRLLAFLLSLWGDSLPPVVPLACEPQVVVAVLWVDGRKYAEEVWVCR